MHKELNQLKTFSFSSILGWSVSRYDKFSLCKRQYYYDYYTRYDIEFPRSKIDQLKKLTSVPLEVGSVFHDIVSEVLKRLLVSEKPIDTERYVAYVKDKMQHAISNKVFSEVYYKAVQSLDEKEILDRVEQLAQSFIKSDRYAWIKEKALTNKSGWVIEPPGYGETRISDYKAYCKVDFLFPVEDKLYILDWKTGKADVKKHGKQLVGYTAWASYQFGTPPESIIPMAVYFRPEYSEYSFEVKQSDVDSFAEGVVSETKEMYEYLDDIMQNIPKPKEKFGMMENTGLCRYCNYRELCGR